MQCNVASSVRPVRHIEGIYEYRLSNDLPVLLIPDDSKSIVTLNMTVFVGSRHEGYGEAGMAHLLEHMLFKGTLLHPNIPGALKQRGANFNGTTWLDRTNYYESLPAATTEQAAQNLEFAAALESDRLMNSLIRRDDLASEMTVVRNEFERGENNSRRILSQRVQAVAFDWHNYGRSTIGNLSDIERVPVERLREFYRKFYRPDNVMLVVAGRLDTAHALRTLEQYFGRIAVPDVPLDRTYTIEPPQDGERSIVLRRVGNTQYISACYHIPCGACREFAAAEMLAYIFAAEPTGRLYQDLILKQLASQVSTVSYGLHDPGVARFEAQVPVDKSIEAARDALLRCVEQVSSAPISSEELSRARSQFLKARQLRAVDSTTIAIELSEWASQGDWRLYFLFRDYVESLTADECTAVANQFFTRNNRTLGMFIPSNQSEKVVIPPVPNITQLLDGYAGRADQTQGEIFDSALAAIEARTIRGRLSSGLHFALLPKRTRGGTVSLELNLRFGNEAALTGLVEAADFLPEMILRGTRHMSYQQLRDRLDELRADVQTTGSSSLLTIFVETTRENLPTVLQVVGEMARFPQLAEKEFELLRQQTIATLESRLSEPNYLASQTLRRALSPYPAANVRYVTTYAERIERYRALQVDPIRELHHNLLNGQHGEVSVVGDFDDPSFVDQLEDQFAEWISPIAYQRIDYPSQDNLAAELHEIVTPQKANAVYYAGMHLPLRDDDPAYPALLIGNYILGNSALTSRLGNKVRQQEGLSYSVGSSISAHPIDRRANFSIYAIFSPKQREKLSEAIREELSRWLDGGVTESELNAAVSGYLQSEQLYRSQDDHIARLLVSSTFAGRDLNYNIRLEQCLKDLTVADVNNAIRTKIDPARLIQVFAGDF